MQRENWLWHFGSKGLYCYAVVTDRDIDDEGGGTQIWFDADTGAFVKILLPSGQHRWQHRHQLAFLSAPVGILQPASRQIMDLAE